MPRPLPFVLSASALVLMASVDGTTADRWLDWTLAGTETVIVQLSKGQAPTRPVVARAEASGLVMPAPLPAAEEWPELPPPDEDASSLEREAFDESEDAHDAVEEDVEDDPDEPRANRPDGPILVSIARETWIFARPQFSSRRLGYLRAGAIVGRDAEPARTQGCKGGWYAIRPHGFVCVGSRASLDAMHPVAQLSSRRPDASGLPYQYVQSRYPTPPLYARLPDEAQQRKVEHSLDHHRRKHERLSRDPDFTPFPTPEPIPSLLADGALVPALDGRDRGADTVSLGNARVRSGFALLGTYDHGDRRFGLTTEMALIPLDRTRVVAESTMQGVHLSDEFPLPVALVRSKHARRYVRHPETGALAIEGSVPWRSALALTGKSIRRGGEIYLEARDGSFVEQDRVVRIDKFRKAPGWARGDKKWVDVSILEQSLVAYEGRRPVFATLVSTGADGLQDHEESHATIQGTFLIHTKHVSVTMDGDDEGDEFDLRDVPWVQYFTEGYALHGAYWHDDFGTPRSHGCVNLAP
ncbi:MAG: L,D-transpeptidase, partial [Polyangiaceae bacterium]